MALIKCPECGRENVSDSAESCPECGYNISQYIITLREKERYNQKLASIPMPPKPKKENIWLKISIAMGVFIAFMGILGLVEPEEFSNDARICIVIGVFCIAFFLYARESNYKVAMEKYTLAVTDFDIYKKKMVEKQEEIERETIKCPHCNSYNARKITTTDRIISTTIVGVASSKIGKQFECKNCGYKW
jgi:DNA-directed RNA polymerase subunit RPC12/RpoP